MNKSLSIKTFNFDPTFFSAVIGLLMIGSIMVSSASITMAENSIGNPHYFLFRHIGALGIGLMGAIIASITPTEFWYRTNGILLISAMMLLVSVEIPGLGHTVNNSTRWLDLGPVTLQPSELARFCLLLYLCGYIVRHQSELNTKMIGFIKPMAIISVACALLLKEPDFGATVVLTATSLGLLFVGGARLRDFFVSFLFAVAILGVLAMQTRERLERLTTFLDPWADPFESGFQLTQSLIAIGRGDLFGVGLGESVQKLFYLPEAHTDFVFAVMAEELGFVGVTLTIILFGIVVFKAISIGPRAGGMNMPFQGLVSTGIGLTLGFQVFINIGVNAGMLPTKGLTLPLISYGRTSLVVTLIMLGILARVYHEIKNAEQEMSIRKARKQSQ